MFIECFAFISLIGQNLRTEIPENNLFPIQLRSPQGLQILLDSILMDDYGGISGALNGRIKDDYTYDAVGNMTHFTYLWNADRTRWVNSTKLQTTFNGNGDPAQVLSYGWDLNSNSWILGLTLVYTYDTNGRMTLNLNTWHSGTPADKTERTYDANGNMTREIWYLWNTNNNQWAKFQKDEFVYDVNGNIAQNTHYNWNSDSSLWHNQYDVLFTYDANLNLTEKSTTFYKPFQENTIARKKVEYTYYPDGKLSQLINYFMHDGTSEWIGDTKEESVYDPDGNKTHRIVTIWDKTFWDNYMTLDYEYDINGNKTQETDNWWDRNKQVWFVRYKFHWYYSERNITGIPDSRDMGIRVFPNPATDLITVDPGDLNSLTLELFDIHGRCVFSQNISGHQHISVSQMQRGVYIYTIRSNQQVQQGKIIIQ